ncbi:hypothetical protein BV22DRAFT_1052602, partial [Leucogyrophana mollusca]
HFLIFWSRKGWFADAAFTLVTYDHLITIDQEVAYFWSGKWSVSRVLYLSSRYLGDTEVLHAVYYGKTDFATCSRLYYAVLALATASLAVNQAAMTLRVWYLFAHKRFFQTIVLAIYVACIVAVVVLNIQSAGVTPGSSSGSGCGSPTHVDIAWRAYLPSIILHSVLYLFTICRALGSTVTGTVKALAMRFLAEGGPLYLVATLSLLYILIGSSMTNVPDAYIPASESFFAEIMITVAVCHTMLSLRTLAAKLHVDPGWLLSHSELSRIRYRRGANEGELLVDIDMDGCDHLELGRLQSD